MRHARGSGMSRGSCAAPFVSTTSTAGDGYDGWPRAVAWRKRMTGGPVVVTGAAGFVGRALCAHFARIDRDYRAVMRDLTAQDAHRPPILAIGDLATAPGDRLAAVVD